MAQSMGFADISMKNGIIVIALASIIIGDAILPSSSKLKNTTRAIAGAVIYKTIGSIAIRLGLKPNDLQAISATIVILFLAQANLGWGGIIGSIGQRKNKLEGDSKQKEDKDNLISKIVKGGANA